MGNGSRNLSDDVYDKPFVLSFIAGKVWRNLPEMAI